MHSRVLTLTVSAVAIFLGCAAAVSAGQSSKPLPYLDPSLPVEQRAADLVSRMTLEEKVSQMMNSSAAIPRLNVPALRLVERGTPRRSTLRLRNHVSAGNRHGGHLGRAARSKQLATVISHRGACQEQRGPPPRQPLHLLRSDLLVAQHQYLSRSALGPRPGDLRRRSIPDRPARRELRRRHAGRRPEVLSRDCHAETLRRALRPGKRAPRLQRRSFAPRSLGYLSPGLSCHHRGRQGRLHHVRLQRGQGQPACGSRPADEDHPARLLELPGLRHLRLRRASMTSVKRMLITHRPTAPTPPLTALLHGTDTNCGQTYNTLPAAVKAGLISRSPTSTYRCAGCSMRA